MEMRDPLVHPSDWFCMLFVFVNRFIRKSEHVTISAINATNHFLHRLVFLSTRRRYLGSTTGTIGTTSATTTTNTTR